MLLDATNELGATLDFKLPLDDANGVVTWGARAASGGATQTLVGGRVRWFVAVDPRDGATPRRLRQVTDAQGAIAEPAAPLIAALAAPDPVAGPGFVATRDGNLITLRLRLRRAPGGDDPIAAHAIVLRLRNGG